MNFSLAKSSTKSKILHEESMESIYTQTEEKSLLFTTVTVLTVQKSNVLKKLSLYVKIFYAFNDDRFVKVL